VPTKGTPIFRAQKYNFFLKQQKKLINKFQNRQIGKSTNGQID